MRSLRFLTAIMVIAPTCSLFIASTVRAQNAPVPLTQPPVQAQVQPMVQPVAQPPVQQPAAATAPQTQPVATPATLGYAPQPTAPVAATPAPIDSIGSGAIPSLPLEVQASNGISFINGGIGDEELAEVKAKAAEFNVHVMLSAKNGEFISDVSLRILDSKDAPLVAVSDAGPYFYAHMAAGTYTLETTAANGEKKTAKITVGAKGTVKQHIVYNE